MKWFVISPMNGLEVFDDDHEGAAKVLKYVDHELGYYSDHGFKPKDFYIFRGERYDFIPPQGKPSLVQTDRR